MVAALAFATCSSCSRSYGAAEVCGDAGALPWSNPHPVAVIQEDGSVYADDVEEPEVRDFGGTRWLLFNDDPPDGNKDLHYARWDEMKQAFVVLGLMPGTGAQTPAVDDNPTLDRDGHFYFISTRTYPKPTESIHSATFVVSAAPPFATLNDIQRLDGLSRAETPWATMGVQVSWDGEWLYFGRRAAVPPEKREHRSLPRVRRGPLARWARAVLHTNLGRPLAPRPGRHVCNGFDPHRAHWPLRCSRQRRSDGTGPRNRDGGADPFARREDAVLPPARARGVGGPSVGRRTTVRPCAARWPYRVACSPPAPLTSISASYACFHTSPKESLGPESTGRLDTVILLASNRQSGPAPTFNRGLR